LADDFFAHSHAVVANSAKCGNDVILQKRGQLSAERPRLRQAERRQLVTRLHAVRPAVLEEQPVDGAINACVAEKQSARRDRKRNEARRPLSLVLTRIPGWERNTNVCGQWASLAQQKWEDGCIMAARVALRAHLSIGDGSVITAKSGIPNDVPRVHVFWLYGRSTISAVGSTTVAALNA